MSQTGDTGAGVAGGGAAAFRPHPAAAPNRAADRLRVLVISFSDLGTDPRVNRQLRSLARVHDVVAAGHAPPDIDGVTFVALEPHPWTLADKLRLACLLKAGRFERAYWSSHGTSEACERLQAVAFDVVLANDIHTLPLALRLAGPRRTVVDLHEYAPGEFEESWRWRFFFRRYNQYLCDRYLRRAAAVLTVSPGIARAYRERYGIEVPVVPNAHAYVDLRPSPLAPGRIRLLHHGAAMPTRRLELLIRLAGHLDDRFTLDLVLVPTVPDYHRHLRELAGRVPRVRILPPAPMRELVARANAYDIGVLFLPDTTLQNRYAMPNKFFEFIQARLAVATGPSEDVSAIVREHGCGVVAPDFSPESLARVLNALDAQTLARLKHASDAAARVLCFEHSESVLLDAVRPPTSPP